MKSQKIRLITPQQAAQMLQDVGLTDLDEKWVQNQIDKGKLPRVVVARKRRVRSDLVEKMIDDWIKEAGGGQRQK